VRVEQEGSTARQAVIGDFGHADSGQAAPSHPSKQSPSRDKSGSGDPPDLV
jgi:hypothetical protein